LSGLALGCPVECRSACRILDSTRNPKLETSDWLDWNSRVDLWRGQTIKSGLIHRKNLTKGETSMAKPKVFVFAPADPTGNAHKMLEDAGCELILGKANWDTPQGNNEDEMAKMAAGCDALMGTSSRSSHITQKILQASKNLRIVAKFTIG